uniref:Uncharacterized protein n=1 Tax=Rhipicephalus pulchellus TaxID=72859 RepID=L7M5C3_RHIPC
MSADSGASGEASLGTEADADERPKDNKSQGDVDGRLMRKDDSGIGSEPADDRPEAPALASNGGQESPDSGNQDCTEAGASEPQEAAGTAEKRPTTETEDDSDGELWACRNRGVETNCWAIYLVLVGFRGTILSRLMSVLSVID